MNRQSYTKPRNLISWDQSPDLKYLRNLTSTPVQWGLSFPASSRLCSPPCSLTTPPGCVQWWRSRKAADPMSAAAVVSVSCLLISLTIKVFAASLPSLILSPSYPSVDVFKRKDPRHHLQMVCLAAKVLFQNITPALSGVKYHAQNQLSPLLGHTLVCSTEKLRHQNATCDRWIMNAAFCDGAQGNVLLVRSFVRMPTASNLFTLWPEGQWCGDLERCPYVTWPLFA